MYRTTRHQRRRKTEKDPAVWTRRSTAAHHTGVIAALRILCGKRQLLSRTGLALACRLSSHHLGPPDLLRHQTFRHWMAWMPIYSHNFVNTDGWRAPTVTTVVDIFSLKRLRKIFPALKDSKLSITHVVKKRFCIYDERKAQTAGILLGSG